MTDKIRKLLALTSSENDHEALSAMRTAQRLMAKDGITWDKMGASNHEQAKEKIEEVILDQDSPWLDEYDYRGRHGVVTDQRIAYVLLNIGPERLHMALELRQQIHSKGFLKPTYETKLDRLFDMARKDQFDRGLQDS